VSAIDALGYLASATVFTTFCMRTMIPLRIAGLASNVLFASYGLLLHVYPVLILHALLFPINLVRLLQLQKLVREVRSAGKQDLAVEKLLPFMTEKRVAAGETLAAKGSRASSLYLLVEGHAEIVEIGKRIEPGAIVGEIGVYSPDQKRSATIVCRTDCRFYELTETQAKLLYFQDPAFGFAVLQLIISRLLANAEQAVPVDKPTG
jgi:CRP/FNR family transcriptional regulator, cyclic AMP receptor protein